LTADGELVRLDAAALRRRLAGPPVLIVHAAAAFRRHGVEPRPAFDLLELFAFVLPAWFCRPTPGGLAEALGLAPPGDLDNAAALLPRLAHRLLRILAAPGREERSDPAAIAAVMGEGGWPWAPFVSRALASR